MSIPSVKIFCRWRPPLSGHEREHANDVTCEETQVTVHLTDPVPSSPHQDKVYGFNRVFGPSATQSDVFTHVARPLVSNMITNATNALVIAYGHSNTGKTYTIDGHGFGKATAGPSAYVRTSHRGLAVRVFRSLFDELPARVRLSMSYVEVYGNKVFDLLNEETDTADQGMGVGRQVSLGHSVDLSGLDSSDSAEISELTRTFVADEASAESLLAGGSALRHRQGTHSMGHAILRIFVVWDAEEASSGSASGMASMAMEEEFLEDVPKLPKLSSSPAAKSSCFQLVDLAGAEQPESTIVSRDILIASQAVNHSLLVLGNLVAALACRSSASVSSSSVNPISESSILSSPLTRLLWSALSSAFPFPTTSHISQTSSSSPSSSRTHCALICLCAPPPGNGSVSDSNSNGDSHVNVKACMQKNINSMRFVRLAQPFSGGIGTGIVAAPRSALSSIPPSSSPSSSSPPLSSLSTRSASPRVHEANVSPAAHLSPLSPASVSRSSPAWRRSLGRVATNAQVEVEKEVDEDLRLHLAVLEAEIKVLRQAVKDEQDSVRVTESEARSLNAALRRSEASVREYRDKLVLAEALSKDLQARETAGQTSIQAAHEEIASLNASVTEAKRKAADLGVELERSREEVTRLKHENSTNVRSHEHIVRDWASRMHTAEKKIAELTGSRAALLEESKGAELALHKAELDYKSEKDNWRSREQHLEKRLADLENQQSDHEAKVQSGMDREQQLTRRTIELQAQIEQRDRQLSAKSEEERNLLEQVEESRRRAVSCVALENELKRVKEEQSKFRTQLESEMELLKKRWEDKAMQWKQERESLEAKDAEHRAKALEWAQKVRACELKEEGSADREAVWNAQHAQLKAHCRSIESESLTHLRAKEAEWAARVKEVRDEKSAALEKIAQHAKACSQLEASLVESKAEIARLQKLVDTLAVGGTKGKGESDAQLLLENDGSQGADASKADLSRAVTLGTDPTAAQFYSEIDGLHSKIHEAERERDVALQKEERVVAQCADLQNQVTQVEQALEAAVQQLDALRQTMTGLETHNAEVMEEYTALLSRFNAERGRIQDLIDRNDEVRVGSMSASRSNLGSGRLRTRQQREAVEREVTESHVQIAELERERLISVQTLSEYKAKMSATQYVHAQLQSRYEEGERLLHVSQAQLLLQQTQLNTALSEKMNLEEQLAENAQLVAKYEDLVKICAEHDRREQVMRSEAESLRASVASLELKEIKCGRVIEDLKDQLGDARAENESVNRILALVKEKKLEVEHDLYETRSTLDVRSTRVETLQGTVAALEERLQAASVALSDQLSAMNDAACRFEQERTKLENDTSLLRTQLTTQQEAYAALQLRHASLQSSHAGLEDELSANKAKALTEYREVTATKKRIRVAEEELALARTRLEQKDAEVGFAQARILELEKSLGQERRQRGAEEQTSVELKHAAAEHRRALTAWKGKCETLKNAVAEARAQSVREKEIAAKNAVERDQARVERDAAKVSVAALESKVVDLTRSVEDEVQAQLFAKSQHEKMMDAVKDQRREARVQRDALTEERDALAAKAAALSDRVAWLDANAEAQRAAFDDEKKATTIASQKALEEVESRLAVLSSDNSRLVQALDAKTIEADLLKKELDEGLAESARKLSKSKRKLKAEQKQHENSQEVLVLATDRRHELERQLTQCQDTITMLSVKIQARDNEHARLEDRISGLEGRMEARVAELKRTSAALAAAEEEVMRLKTELAKAKPRKRDGSPTRGARSSTKRAVSASAVSTPNRSIDNRDDGRRRQDLHVSRGKVTPRVGFGTAFSSMSEVAPHRRRATMMRNGGQGGEYGEGASRSSRRNTRNDREEQEALTNGLSSPEGGSGLLGTQSDALSLMGEVDEHEMNLSLLSRAQQLDLAREIERSQQLSEWLTDQ